MNDDTTRGWGISITAHEDATRDEIARWAREAHGIEIEAWDHEPIDMDDGTRMHTAIAAITPAIVDALRDNGEWHATAGDGDEDEDGCTIDIDAGDVDLGGGVGGDPQEDDEPNDRAWHAVDRAEAAEAKAKAAAEAAHKANPDSEPAKDAADRWAETNAHMQAARHAAQGAGMDTSDEQRNRAANRAERCAINAEESAIEAGWHQQEAEAEATENEDGDER